MRGRLGAVRGAESVVHVDIAECGDLLRERLVVLLLALVEPAVLEQHDLPGFHMEFVFNPTGNQGNVETQ